VWWGSDFWFVIVCWGNDYCFVIVYGGAVIIGLLLCVLMQLLLVGYFVSWGSD